MSNNEPVMHYKWLLYCYLLSIKLLSDPLPQSINLSPILKDAAQSIGLMDTLTRRNHEIDFVNKMCQSQFDTKVYLPGFVPFKV